MGSDMHRCIYCMNEKPLEEFNREHVFPKAFGTFAPDSPVLHGMVCMNCNGRMGREIENIVTHGSMEGFLRYVNSMPPSKKIRDLDQRRVHLTLPDPPDWRGVRVTLQPSDDGKQYVITMQPQLGFKARGETGWRCRTISNIEGDPSCIEGLPRDSIAVFADGKEQETIARKKLLEIIPNFNEEGEISPPFHLWRGG